MIRTYVDAGVLIAATRGNNQSATSAVRLLNDREREFVASLFLQLEVLPKALYYKQQDEAEFYQDFFAGVQIWTQSLEQVAQKALYIAQQGGLSAMDALHVASAIAAGSKELITTEKPDKPIYRVSGINVIALQSIT